jgi:cobalamin biosynthesis protein CobT
MDAESKEEKEKNLNTIMDKKIIAKEFKRMKGQIPEFYVQKRCDTVLKTRFGDDPLKISKALYGQGKTKLTYKDDILEEVIMECMCERNVTKTNNVIPLEIQDYYDLHRSELVQKRQFDIDQIIVKKEDQEAIARINEYLASGWSYEKEYQEISQIPGVMPATWMLSLKVIYYRSLRKK